MKIVRFFGIFLFSICLVGSQSCKEEPVIMVPVSVKILGLWKQIEAREDGFVVGLDPYQTLNFMADNKAIVKVFDSNDVEIDNTNDVWALEDNNTKINFDVEQDLDIVEITETQLIVKYPGTNQIGQAVEKQDTYQKQ